MKARETERRPRVYLDHNATTPVLDEVVEAMLPYLREHFGNPSSGHAYGRAAREGLEEARGELAMLLGCAPDEIYFTGGGTEASNLAIFGALEASKSEGALVTSTIEHPATSVPAAYLERGGQEVACLQVGADGRVDLERARWPERVALLSVMHANNETGVIQPVRALADEARRRGGLVHTDAAQSVGKIAVDVDELGVDLLTVAGHKLYAPKGIGALYLRRGTSIAPRLLGAGHERGIRPGTENVAYAVGLGRAARIARRDLEVEAARVGSLRDALWTLLAAQIPGLALHGVGAPRLPNTLSVRFPDASGASVLAGAPEIAASTGSACHANRESASAVIRAMGVPENDALGTVRLSLGRHTSAEQIDRAARALASSWREVSARRVD